MSEGGIPSTWRLVELKNIATFVSGGTPSRKKSDYFTGTTPWLTGYDLPEDQVTFVDEGREYITEEAIEESATNLVPPQTILLTTRVTVGKVAIAQKSLCFSQDVTGIIIDNTEIIDPTYLAHFLLAIREAFLFRNRGTTIQGIIRRDLERFQILLPPLSEQRRIVDILRQADDLRCLRREADVRMANLQASLFYEMFGDPIEPQPGWKEEKLSTFVDVTSSLVDPKEDKYSELPHIGSDNIESNTGRLIGLQTTQEVGSISGKFLFTLDNVLYSKIRPALRKVATPEFIGLCSADIYPLSFNSTKVTRQFLAQLLRSQHFTAYASRVSWRAQIPKINRKDLLRYRTILPTLEDQQDFEHRLNETIGVRKLTGEITDHLGDLFDSLLARASTGKLTATWREQHAAQLQEEATQRDMALGLHPRGRGVDFATELDTPGGREAFDCQVQEALQPTVAQLVEAITPKVRLGDILKIEPLVDLNQLVSPVLAAYRTTVNASLLRGIEQLSKAAQESLAESAKSVQALLQSVVGAHQQQMVELAGQLAQMAVLISRRPDKEHPRYHSLRALSDEQYRVYLAALQSDGYFTAESLLDEDDLPVDNVRRTLALLETLGLVVRVNVPAAPTGTALFYVIAYRAPVPDDDGRDDDLGALEAAFPELAA